MLMALVLALLLVALLLVALVLGVGLWRNPYRLIQYEFTRQRRRAGLTRATLQVSNHRWVYAHCSAVTADAPTLVLLHGFTGSKENWYPLAKALAGRYRLLIPDLPGWGESERKPGAVYGFVEQAAHVAAFIQALSPNAPVILLGHSMGGGIAALVAARYPSLVAQLGLFNAAGVRFNDNAFGLQVLAGENPFAVHDAASLHRYVDSVFFEQRAKPWIPWPASAALIAKRCADAAFEQSVMEAIGRSEQSLLPGEEAARIHQPTLLVWGKQDAVIDASALALYGERIPQAQQVLLDRCGHMSMVEHPQQVAEIVVKWLQAPVVMRNAA